MALSVRIDRVGGPEVMKMVENPVPPPGPGEIRLRHAAIGLNFIDVYQRSGLYPLPLPSAMGSEAAGTVTEVGPNVTGFAVGDRVAYASAPIGAYCDERVYPADRAVRVPPEVSTEAAAGLMLKGMTAYYLLHLTFPIRPGHIVLMHAAAGGVGSVLIPWAKHLGATVIGTAGSADKARAARAAGCDEVILYREQDVAREVKRITAGRGVDVVYDSVGKDTFMGSLDSLKRRGMMVSFGNASGSVPPIAPLLLSEKGSLFLTRPTLIHHTATRAELEAAAQALFGVLASGIVKPQIGQRYALKDVARAHADLEARRTTGTSLLIP